MGETCDYATVKPDQSHGLARHKVRGYEICDSCYRAMRAAEAKWDEAQDAANFPAAAPPVVVPVDAAPSDEINDRYEDERIDQLRHRGDALSMDAIRTIRRLRSIRDRLRSRLTAVEQQHLEANRRYAELWDEVASVRQERDELAARIRRMSL